MKKEAWGIFLAVLIVIVSIGYFYFSDDLDLDLSPGQKASQNQFNENEIEESIEEDRFSSSISRPNDFSDEENPDFSIVYELNNIEQPEYNDDYGGWIVILNSPSVSEIFPEEPDQEDEGSGQLGQSINLDEPTSEEIENQRDLIEQEQLSFLEEFERLFPNEQIHGSVQTALNAVFISKISESDILELENLPMVKSIHKDGTVQPHLMDSVPLIGANDVWGKNSQEDQCSGEDCLTGKGIKIGILDTGVDYNHPDLGGCFGQGCKVVDGYDFVNEDSDPMDDHGHGTYTASIAAGNGLLNGVAPDAKIVAYKVLDARGIGTFSWIISAVERSTDPNQNGDLSDHLVIISLSLGKYCEEYSNHCGPNDPMSRAIDNIFRMGIISTISAGNAGPGKATIGTPGTARKGITIGASDKNDDLAWFSSKGPIDLGEEIVYKPDVVAPGVDICAAAAEAIEEYSNCLDSQHFLGSGTSASAPHVAGMIALVLQRDPDIGMKALKKRIKGSSKDVHKDQSIGTYRLWYHETNKNLFGGGRINAYDAVFKEKEPQFRLDQIKIKEYQGDGDNVAEPGETAEILIDIQNVWEKAQNVKIRIRTQDDSIQFDNNVIDVSSISNDEIYKVVYMGVLSENMDFPTTIETRLIIDIDGERNKFNWDIPLTFFKPCKEGDICEVCRFEDLDSIRFSLEGNYKQVCDIDLAGKNLEPIGDLFHAFRGTYDGNGYSIMNFRLINEHSPCAGLFCQMVNAEVKNIRLENVLIEDSASSYLGGLSGYTQISNIENTYVTGKIITDNEYIAGGLTGTFYAGMAKRNISNSHVDMEIISTSPYGFIGGLVGDVLDYAGEGSGDILIYNSSSKGELIAEPFITWIGGLAGGITASAQNSFSEMNISLITSNIEGEEGFVRIGGLFGDSFTNAMDHNHYSGFINGEIMENISELKVGGLSGSNGGNADSIKNSYSKGNINIVINHDTRSIYIGGLTAEGSSSKNSYSNLDIFIDANSKEINSLTIGGLSSQQRVNNSYSSGIMRIINFDNVNNLRVGGLLGSGSSDSVTSSYWDIETSGLNWSAGGEGRTTEEMTSVPRPENTYVNWDFVNVWDQTDGEYPWLRN